MKDLKALEQLKEYIESENRVGDLSYAHYSNIIDYINEAIEQLQNRSCNKCKHYDFIMPQNNPHDQYNYWGCLKNINVTSPSDFYCSKHETKGE